MINLNQLKNQFEIAQSKQGIFQPYYNHYYKVINKGCPKNHFERVIDCIKTILLEHTNKELLKVNLDKLKKEIEFLKGGKKGLAPLFSMQYGRSLTKWSEELDKLSQEDLIKELKESYEKYNYKDKHILNSINTVMLVAKRAGEEKLHNSIETKSQQPQTSILFNIPRDILLSILSACDIQTIDRFTRICTHAYQLINMNKETSDLFWKAHAFNASDKYHHFKTAFFKKYVVTENRLQLVAKEHNAAVTAKASDINDNQSAQNATVSFKAACRDVYTDMRETRRKHEKLEEDKKALDKLKPFYQNRPHRNGIS